MKIPAALENAAYVEYEVSAITCRAGSWLWWYLAAHLWLFGDLTIVGKRSLDNALYASLGWLKVRKFILSTSSVGRAIRWKWRFCRRSSCRYKWTSMLRSRAAMHNLPPVVEFSTVVGDDEESCTVAECVIALASPDDSDMSIWRGWCTRTLGPREAEKKVPPVAKFPKNWEEETQKRLGVI